MNDLTREEREEFDAAHMEAQKSPILVTLEICADAIIPLIKTLGPAAIESLGPMFVATVKDRMRS